MFPHGVRLISLLANFLLFDLQKGLNDSGEFLNAFIPLFLIQVGDPGQPPYEFLILLGGKIYAPYPLIEGGNNRIHLSLIDMFVELGERRIFLLHTIRIGHYIHK